MFKTLNWLKMGSRRDIKVSGGANESPGSVGHVSGAYNSSNHDPGRIPAKIAILEFWPEKWPDGLKM